MKSLFHALLLVFAPALFLAIGCGRGGAPGNGGPTAKDKPVAFWIEKLKSKNPSDREAAFGALSGVGKNAKPAAPVLCEILKTGDMRDRLRAARLLGFVGAEEKDAVPALCAGLKDEDAQIREAAVAAITQIGSEAQAATPALIEAYLEELRQKPPDRPAQKDEKLTPAEFSKQRRDAIIVALAQIGPSALLTVVKADNALIRDRAEDVLIKMNGDAKPAVPGLVEILKEGDASRRHLAASLLARIGPPAKDAVPALSALLKEKDQALRLASARALWLIEKHQGYVALLIEGLKDTDPNIRGRAAHAIIEVGPQAKEAVPALIANLGDKNEVRDPSIAALAKIGPASVPALALALQDKEARVRVGAAYTLVELGPKADAAAPALADALNDKETYVRLLAAEALGRIGAGSKLTVPALTDALKNGDAQVREVAAKGLGTMGPAAKAAVPALIGAATLVNFKERTFTKEDIELLAVIEAQLLGFDVHKSTRKWLKDKRDAGMIWGAFALELEVLAGARRAAAEALQKVDHAAVSALVPQLVEALADKEPACRYCSATTLNYLSADARTAAPALLKVLNDNDARVRRAVTEAIQKIDPEAAKRAGVK